MLDHRHCVRTKQIRTINVRDMAESEGIQLGHRFNEMSDKFLYKYPDRRDNLLVRYMLGYGFMDKRLFPKCKLCESQENRKLHVTIKIEKVYISVFPISSEMM